VHLVFGNDSRFETDILDGQIVDEPVLSEVRSLGRPALMAYYQGQSKEIDPADERQGVRHQHHFTGAVASVAWMAILPSTLVSQSIELGDIRATF